MPRKSTFSDADGLRLLAEMEATGQGLAPTARQLGYSEDAAQRWKKRHDARVALGEIEAYRPNFAAQLDTIIDRLGRDR